MKAKREIRREGKKNKKAKAREQAEAYAAEFAAAEEAEDPSYEPEIEQPTPRQQTPKLQPEPDASDTMEEHEANRFGHVLQGAFTQDRALSVELYCVVAYTTDDSLILAVSSSKKDNPWPCSTTWQYELGCSN